MQAESKQSLFDREYDQWLQEQAGYLKTHDYEHLDIVNLVEELEALGRSEKRAAKSLTLQILIHLLLVDYWVEKSSYNKDHWETEIKAFRDDLEDILTTNISKLIVEKLPDIYSLACFRAAKKKDSILASRFPETCPYSLDQIRGKAKLLD